MRLKHLFLLFSGFLSVSSALSLQAATLVPTSSLQEGLVVYMSYDGTNKNSYDSYTNYTGGVNWGNGNITTTTGFDDTGAFNPSSSNMGTGAIGSANISAQDFTVSFQFKDIVLSNNTWALRMTTTGGQTLQFEMLSSNPGRIQFYAGGTNAFYAGSTGNLSGTVADWQTFTMTSSASGVAMYINGTQVMSNVKTLNAGTLNFFQLGCNLNGTNVADMKTDDFALWNRALTQEEITFIASNPASKAIPEPATASLSLLGLMALMARRRRNA